MFTLDLWHSNSWLLTSSERLFYLKNALCQLHLAVILINTRKGEKGERGGWRHLIAYPAVQGFPNSKFIFLATIATLRCDALNPTFTPGTDRHGD